jgi:hypothetical protein
MTSTPRNHLVRTAAVALGIVAVSCRADNGTMNPIPPSTSPGYSYDHDSHHD